MIVKLCKKELKKVYGGQTNSTIDISNLKVVYPCVWERSSPYAAVIIGTLSGIVGMISVLQGTGNTYGENKKMYLIGSISAGIIMGFIGGMGILLSVGGCHRCEPGDNPIIVKP